MNLQSYVSKAKACNIFHGLGSTIAEFTLEPYINFWKGGERERVREREKERDCASEGEL